MREFILPVVQNCLVLEEISFVSTYLERESFLPILELCRARCGVLRRLVLSGNYFVDDNIRDLCHQWRGRVRVHLGAFGNKTIFTSPNIGSAQQSGRFINRSDCQQFFVAQPQTVGGRMCEPAEFAYHENIRSTRIPTAF
jgi:hypothetical protein